MQHAGKWNKHVDGWDCLTNQEFFSLEGAAFVVRQMVQVSKPPNRPTPEFNIMKKYKDWEIRRWDWPPAISAHQASQLSLAALYVPSCPLPYATVERLQAGILALCVLLFGMCHHTALAYCCRYKPYVAAQVASKPEAEAEALLREYLAGANEGRREFEPTTPLLHSSHGAVSLMIPGVQVSTKRHRTLLGMVALKCVLRFAITFHMHDRR